MTVESIIKVMKTLKPNQCYLIGGTLVTGGFAGSASPFWYPLVDDAFRGSLNLATKTEEYSASPITIGLSLFAMVLGFILILANRFLEHKETIQIAKLDNVVELRRHSKPTAFEADSGGQVIINGGTVKNYESVAKASNQGVVKINDTDVEK